MDYWLQKKSIMAAGNYKTPPIFCESKPYNRWVDEVKVWQSITELEENKQAPAYQRIFKET